MSTGCEFNDDRLVRYAAGRLDPGERTALDGHLAGCDACRAELAVISALRAAPPRAPAGLEARIRHASREQLRAVAGARGRREDARGRARRFAGRWAPWAVPLAAAAAVTLWVGIETPWSGNGAEVEVAQVEEFEPYGSWPAGGVVAGEPVLSDLTVEELERLLEEMR